MFNDLLGLITNPYGSDKGKEELTHIVQRTKDGLERLFGKHNGGVYRLQSWLDQANDDGIRFTKQQAFQEIRNMFPSKPEAPESVYLALKLDVTDEALANGIRDWEQEERSTTKKTMTSEIITEEEGEIIEDNNIWSRHLKKQRFM